jgi:hypothetical protein
MSAGAKERATIRGSDAVSANGLVAVEVREIIERISAEGDVSQTKG